MGSEYNRKQIIGDGLEVFLDIENFKSVNVGMGDTIWKSIVGEYKGSLSYSSYYNFNYSDGGASSDGSPSSWMPTNTAGANTNAWQGITYGPEHSGPPTTWTATDATSNITWTDIIYGNGTYVAVAWTGTGDKIMYSTDAINWTATADGNSKSWVGVAYGNGKFVAISDSGSGNNQIMYSTDGITWSNTNVNYKAYLYGGSVSNPSGVPDNQWWKITYGSGYFVAVSSDGDRRVMYSPDGISWVSTEAGYNDIEWKSLGYGDGRFVSFAHTGSEYRGMYNRELDKKKCFNFVPFSSSNIDVYNATSYYDNITVSLWFKVWNTSNASLLKKGSDFHLELDSSGAIQCTVNGTTFFSNASVYNINTWYNVTVIDSLNLRKIYLNGVDIIPAGQANSTSTVLRPYGGDSWRLAGTGGFNGSMTMLQIYKRMLSTDEIIKNYQAQKDSYNL